MSHVSPRPGSSICRMKPASTMARYSVSQRLGDGEHVRLLGRVVLILAPADHRRRDGGHEGLGDVDALEGGLEGGEVTLEQRLALVGDGSLCTRWAPRPAASPAAGTPCSTRGTRATPAGCRPAAPRRHRRWSARRSGRRGRGHEARQPFVGVGEEARLAHLAVGDDVEADLGLSADHVGHRLGRRAPPARPRRSPGRPGGRGGGPGCSRDGGCCRRGW